MLSFTEVLTRPAKNPVIAPPAEPKTTARITTKTEALVSPLNRFLTTGSFAPLPYVNQEAFYVWLVRGS